MSPWDSSKRRVSAIVRNCLSIRCSKRSEKSSCPQNPQALRQIHHCKTCQEHHLGMEKGQCRQALWWLHRSGNEEGIHVQRRIVSGASFRARAAGAPGSRALDREAVADKQMQSSGRSDLDTANRNGGNLGFLKYRLAAEQVDCRGRGTLWPTDSLHSAASSWMAVHLWLLWAPLSVAQTLGYHKES